MKVKKDYTLYEFTSLFNDLRSRSNQTLEELSNQLEEGHIYDCINKEIFNKLELHYKRLCKASFENCFHLMANLDMMYKQKKKITVFQTMMISISDDKQKQMQNWMNTLEKAEKISKNFTNGLKLASEAYFKNLKADLKDCFDS